VSTLKTLKYEENLFSYIPFDASQRALQKPAFGFYKWRTCQIRRGPLIRITKKKEADLTIELLRGNFFSVNIILLVLFFLIGIKFYRYASGMKMRLMNNQKYWFFRIPWETDNVFTLYILCNNKIIKHI